MTQDQIRTSLPNPTVAAFLWLSLYHDLFTEAVSSAYLRQENVPNSAPAAMPTAKPIMKPIFTLSKQLGCDCPYGPMVTGISLPPAAPHPPPLPAPVSASGACPDVVGRGGCAQHRGYVGVAAPGGFAGGSRLSVAFDGRASAEQGRGGGRTAAQAGGGGSGGGARGSGAGRWSTVPAVPPILGTKRRWRRRPAAALHGRAGHHPAGSQSPGQHAPISDSLLRQSPLQDPCLWLGE